MWIDHKRVLWNPRGLTAVAIVLLVAAPNVAFSQGTSTKVCDLLTKAELSAAGLTVDRLLPDYPAFVKKGSVPGVNVDSRIDQCLPSTALEDGTFPVRWSVFTLAEPLDKKRWQQLAEAMEAKEPKAVADPSLREFRIGDSDCETRTWYLNKTAKPILVVSCTEGKGRYQVSVEVTHRDPRKLVSPEKVKLLLDRILGRL
jgi:hypothetical protein